MSEYVIVEPLERSPGVKGSRERSGDRTFRVVRCVAQRPKGALVPPQTRDDRGATHRVDADHEPSRCDRSVDTISSTKQLQICEVRGIESLGRPRSIRRNLLARRTCWRGCESEVEITKPIALY